MTPWPHQLFAVKAIMDADTRGTRRLVVTSPTGGGKSLIMQMTAKEWLDREAKAILYSNRKFVMEQISKGLLAAGMYHGVRAAGHDDERDHPFQISSIQTEHSRVTKKKTWELHKANLVLVDEGHLQKGPKAMEILKAHYDAGAMVVFFTATPLDMEGMADELIVAGTMSELRKCGAIVPCVHYGADEPDLRQFKKLQQGQDPTEKQQRNAIMTPTIFGRVWDWYEKLNPARKPCILFGPGVNESLWFAERFTSKGVKAAHLDGNDVWLEGKWYKADQKAREALEEASKAGDIKVVCNRYVLREGVDWPWIEHIILGFVAGSLKTYLQTVGRGLRACQRTGKTELILQDHGGAWWRHGSINLNRQWMLELTDAIAYGLRAERLRTKKEREPFRCPRCGRVWGSSAAGVCLQSHGGCGFELGNTRQSRPVVSTEGQLREMVGDIFKPRRITKRNDGPEIWKRMYYRSKTDKGARTFNAAMALFAQENNWGWPDPMWPLMPIDPMDFFRLVSKVENLR